MGSTLPEQERSHQLKLAKLRALSLLDDNAPVAAICSMCNSLDGLGLTLKDIGYRLSSLTPLRDADDVRQWIEELEA